MLEAKANTNTFNIHVLEGAGPSSRLNNAQGTPAAYAASREYVEVQARDRHAAH